MPGAKRSQIESRCSHVALVLAAPRSCPASSYGTHCTKSAELWWPCVVLQRRIDRACGCTTRWSGTRRAGRACTSAKPCAQRVDHVVLVGQQVDGRAELAAVLGQAGEVRQPLQREVHLERRAGRAGSRRARALKSAGRAARADQLAHAERIGVDDHDGARAISSPSASTTPRDRAAAR